ncbi:MAG: cell surface protein SprA [Candidatus Marinimicrobia bacterium]|nr:cell surface protein SprA [Candidatus Neomarinimicrobiota bacterium]
MINSDSREYIIASRRFILLLSLLVAQITSLYAESGKEPSIYSIPGFVPILKKSFQGLYWSDSDSNIVLDGAFLPLRVGFFKSIVELDSSAKYFTFRKQYRGKDIQAPTVISVKDYYLLAMEKSLLEDWTLRVEDVLKRERERGRGGAIEIIGGSIAGQDVALRVTGNINIRGGLRNENRSTVAQNFAEARNTSFKLDQKQQFNIEGTIGDKISILVDQDSERDFEFENALKIRYLGDEDEIIKRIDAGNIDLSLPGTRFAVSGGRNQGLFGIKSLMRIGGLDITTIASVERGKKEKLTLEGGATSQARIINDYDYVKGTYFFLSNTYKDALYPTIRTQFVRRASRIKNIEVYVTAAGNETGNFEAMAVPEPDDVNDPGFDLALSGGEKGRFKRLTKNVEYEINENLGFIRMNTFLNSNDILAVTFENDIGVTVGGQIITQGENQDTLVVLKMIRSRNHVPTHPTWDLEFKNVYFLGATGINKEGFELTVVFDRGSAEPQERDSNGTNYLQIFGLDSLDVNGKIGSDEIFDIETSSIINLARGELWFPALRPFEAPRTLPPTFYSPQLYDTTAIEAIQAASKFKIMVSYKNRSSILSLGINVIEGSEEVILDGVLLSRGTDYSVDYFTGQLTLLKDGATDPGANLEIKYEKNQLFQLDKKSLLGTRAEYRFGDSSYLGGTFLFFSKSTIDQKIRVGEEPIKNMLWDINGKIDLKPNFITRGVNALPMFKTDQASAINIEGEIAQIIPNPNTLNSIETGDNNGVAYLDDFEASKRITSLSIIRRHWFRASPPDPQNFKGEEERAFTYWYNPFERVLTQEIWEDRDIGSQAGNLFTDILNITIDAKNNRFDKPDSTIPSEQRWGGVMRALPASFFDQTQTKFIEIWVNGNEGLLNIDIGHISEDANDDGEYNTEDVPVGGTIGNNLLDEGEDLGIDGLIDEEEPGYDAISNKDPNADNWRFDPNQREIDYRRINGTEGNRRDEGGFIPDTEDLNRNTFLDTRNDFFRYSFWLDGRDDQLIAGGRGNDKGWRLYRLPLKEFNFKSGPGASFQDIQYVRIWATGLNKEKSIKIATIELVGNEWQEIGVLGKGATDFDKNDSSFTITVVNTEDNSDIYDGKRENGDPDLQPPPGVTGQEDRLTRVRAKEQSLVLKFNDLAPGAFGAARKVFFKEIDIARYKKLKMFVHGDKHFGKDSSSVEFIIRIGRSNESYYEISEPIYPGWDDRNHIDIDLEALTRLKLKDGEVFNLGNGKKARIVNSPSITRLRQLVVGVKNNRKVIPISGQIWLDELRVSDIRRESGIAARGSASIKFADIGNMNFNIDRVDANFHKVEDKLGSTGSSTERVSYRFNNTFQSNKLLPARWGLSIPITFNISRQFSKPKFFPGTDVLVQGSAPDSIKNIGRQSKFGISFKKNSKSRRRILKYTIDKSTGNLSILNQSGSNSQIFEKSLSAYNGSFAYKLPVKKRSKLRPFFWTKSIPWLGGKLSDQKFNYYPNSFNWNLKATESKSRSIPRRGKPSESYKFNMVRNLKTGFPIFKSMNLEYGRGWTNDLSDLRGSKSDIFSGDFGALTNANETFSARWNPKVFNWLQTGFGYNNNYRLQLQRARQLQSNDVSSQKQMNANLNFNLKKFMSFLTPKKSDKEKAAAKKTAKKRRPGRRARKKPKQKEEAIEKKGKKNPTLGELITKLSQKLQPVTFSISKSTNITNPAVFGAPSLAYKLGLTDNPNLVKDSLIVAENRKSENTNITAKSGLNISRNLTVNFSYGQNERKSRTSASNLNITKSRDFFPLGELGNEGIPFPTWNVRLSGLEKISFFSKIAKTVSLEHGFSGKENEKILETIVLTNDSRIDSISSEVTGKNYSKSWQPLVGLNLNLKGDVSVTIRYNSSSSISNFFGIRDGTQIINTSNLSVTANYSRRGGFRLPIFFFRDFKLDNQVTFSLNYNRGKNLTRSRTGPTTNEFATINKSNRWTLQPQMNYSFSSKLNGGVFFEIGKTETINGTTSFQDFGLTVNITIRG